MRRRRTGTNKNKDDYYEKIQEVFDEFAKEGPVFILRDLNARLGKPINKIEKEATGQYTFLHDLQGLQKESEEVQDNRSTFIKFL